MISIYRPKFQFTMLMISIHHGTSLQFTDQDFNLPYRTYRPLDGNLKCYDGKLKYSDGELKSLDDKLKSCDGKLKYSDANTGR